MELFPPIPYQDWRETKDTLHRFAQIVGKIRLSASARRNHWWNVPFHLTGRGITTRPMRLDDGTVFCLDFDFVAHRLVATTAEGRQSSFPLAGCSVAGFYTEVLAALRGLGVEVDIAVSRPFDLPDSDRPFAEDTEHRSYDPAAATRYWQVLSQVNLLLEDYAADYSGKTSPVHHFWHTFDIAVTRFGDRVVDQPAQVDPVTREAYSREVVSAGFWFGDENFGEPAFYSYTAPEPDGLSDQPLDPPAARWIRQRQSHLAVLRYDDARAAADPWATALGFFRSAYQAGASLAGWDTSRMACPGGVTDPAAGSAADLVTGSEGEPAD
jgi:hypothetical protein